MSGLYPKGTRVVARDKTMGGSKASSIHWNKYVKGSPLYYIRQSEDRHVLSTTKYADMGDFFAETDFTLYSHDLGGEEL